MAQTLEHLTQRTGTLESIRGIVRTMKTMSAINAQPYEQAARAIDAYRDTVLDGFHAFLSKTGPLTEEPRHTAAKAVIALGSDHGLCGNYNELIAAEVANQPEARTGARIICVGAQLEDALIGLELTPEATLLTPASADGLGRLASDLVTRLDTIRATTRGNAGATLAATLVFMKRGQHGQQAPVAQHLLPLDRDLIASLAHRRWPSRSLPQFSLPAPELLAILIRNLLFATMFRAAAEALVTENAARLARMQQAEQSVDERLEELRSESRSVRQSEITTELLDVIVGFEALKNRRH